MVGSLFFIASKVYLRVILGSFGLPTGVVFSQPVLLDGKYWRPFKDFPLSKEAGEQIVELVSPALEVLEKFNAGIDVFNSKEDVVVPNSYLM